MAALDNFMNAIGTIESGNDYNAVGVDTGKMGRALGRYQIMSANWGAWSREAGLGSHADWKDPRNQDAVARYMMGKYYARYKNWDLVATAWFGGPGAANKAEKAGVGTLDGTKDALGTSVPEYVRRYREVWDPSKGDGGNSQARADQQPKGPAGKKPRAKQSMFSQPWSAMVDAARPGRASGGRGSLIAPIEAAPGTVLTPEQEATRDAQMTQDSLGAIMASMSEHMRGQGGGVLDARQMFGMPAPEASIVEGIPTPTTVEAPQPSQPANPTQADAADAKLAPPPEHDGFAPLKENAKKGTQQLMAQFPGLRFTSGYRDPVRNKAAGGVANSKHLTGEASDFVGSEEEMQAAAAWAKAQGAKVLVHDSGSGRHLHIEWA